VAGFQVVRFQSIWWLVGRLREFGASTRSRDWNRLRRGIRTLRSVWSISCSARVGQAGWVHWIHQDSGGRIRTLCQSFWSEPYRTEVLSRRGISRPRQFYCRSVAPAIWIRRALGWHSRPWEHRSSICIHTLRILPDYLDAIRGLDPNLQDIRAGSAHCRPVDADCECMVVQGYLHSDVEGVVR